MALTEMPDFTFKHTAQVDKPNIPADTMKANFDSQAVAIREYLNTTLKTEVDSKATVADLANLAGEGRTNETVKGNADAIASHLAETAAHGIGDKSTLLTTEKSTIVGAVNELFTDVSNGKTSIASAIADMGQLAAGSDTFTQLAAKIRDISDDATAGVGDVLSPKTFYQGGVKRIGTIPSKGAATYTPSTGNQVIAAGQYLSGPQTIIPGIAIKSIQRGIVSFPADTTTVTATAALNEVDLNKSILIFRRRIADNTNINLHYSVVCGYLTSSNQLTFHIMAFKGAVVSYIEWTVIEFEGNVTVQSAQGTWLAAGTTLDIPISAVNIEKSFILSNSNINVNSQNHVCFTTELTSETNVRFTRGGDGGGGALGVEYSIFVVTMN